MWGITFFLLLCISFDIFWFYVVFLLTLTLLKLKQREERRHEILC